METRRSYQAASLYRVGLWASADRLPFGAAIHDQILSETLRLLMPGRQVHAPLRSDAFHVHIAESCHRFHTPNRQREGMNARTNNLRPVHLSGL